MKSDSLLLTVIRAIMHLIPQGLEILILLPVLQSTMPLFKEQKSLSK